MPTWDSRMEHSPPLLQPWPTVITARSQREGDSRGHRHFRGGRVGPARSDLHRTALLVLIPGPMVFSRSSG
ncbi:hypothetical protein BJX68DRAFT_229077 [Aspergillus pseudodeflectus]|uniref:Uncharacterized protein n=1 Tax=Aspergillus pseudodeflectus TaxID=176178 RepID=A0ABR4KZ46_9EURO